MWDQAVDYRLEALKLNTDWFFTSKMLDKFGNASHANDGLHHYNGDFVKVTFTANQRHIIAVGLYLNNDNIFYEDDLDATINIKFLAGQGNFRNGKHLQKWKLSTYRFTS